MKVLIAVHNDSLRELLALRLTTLPEIGAVSLVANRNGEVEQVAWTSWDVVLVDAFLGGWGGLRLLHRIKAERPQQPVVVVSHALFAPAVYLCLRLGAAAVIEADASATDLLLSLQAALSGQTYLGTGIRSEFKAWAATHSVL